MRMIDKLDDGIREIICEIVPNNPKNNDKKIFEKQQNNNSKYTTKTNNNIISIKIGEDN